MSSYSLAVNTQESQFQQPQHIHFLEKFAAGSAGPLSQQNPQSFPPGFGLKQLPGAFSVSHLLDLGEVPKENCGTMYATNAQDSMSPLQQQQQQQQQHGGPAPPHSPVPATASSPSTACAQRHSAAGPDHRRFSGGHSDCSSPDSGRKSGENNTMRETNSYTRKILNVIFQYLAITEELRRE